MTKKLCDEVLELLGEDLVINERKTIIHFTRNFPFTKEYEEFVDGLKKLDFSHMGGVGGLTSFESPFDLPKTKKILIKNFGKAFMKKLEKLHYIEYRRWVG